MQMPPATFEIIVLSLRAQAEMHLGLMYFGSEEEKPEPDLDLARHAIDLMSVLQQKTRGNLTLEEQRALDNSVTELRFRFIQVSDELRKRPAEKKEEPAHATASGDDAPSAETQAS